VAGLSVGLVWTARSNGGSVLPAPASAEAVDQAERSLAYTRLVLGGDLAADIAYEPATDAAARALALDPTLADAHVAAGYAAMWGRWDWASADRLFRAAIDGHPYSARAHQAHALWLSARGRHAEALAAIDTSRRLDRTSIDVARDAARLAFLAGRVDTAVSRLQALLVERPDDAPAHELLSLALSSRGENRVAAGHFERYLVLIGIDPRYATVDAQVLAESGFRGLTRWHLSRPSTKPADRYGVPFKLASSHALVGNHEAALHWLERARHQRDSRLLFVNVDPRFAGLRDDPRFRRLIAEVGL
jgi:tetratricopeptide (TPR) repeat protein